MHFREQERALLKRKLLAGTSIHMPAPRRIGKTWTVSRLSADLENDGVFTVQADVEGMRTPAAFAREICQRIEAKTTLQDRFRKHFAQRMTNILSGEWGSNPLDALGKVNPVEFLETLIASLDETESTSVILIDEIAYFFLECAKDDAKAARDFAYKLRAIKQRYKNVRWLLTGSIGLDTIARQYELEGAFVDFEKFILEPFTPAEARSYMRDANIKAQFNHIFDADDDALDHLFSQLGWLSPYYLKLVANEVHPSIPAEGSRNAQATKEDIDAAIDKLLQPTKRMEFATWREHVTKNIEHSTLALHLLHGLSKSTQDETIDTLIAQAAQKQKSATPRQIKDIINILEVDGLIASRDGRYAFRSGIVRRYWHEYEAD